MLFKVQTFVKITGNEDARLSDYRDCSKLLMTEEVKNQH